MHQDAANIKGKVLVCVDSEDPFLTVDQRLAFEAEMRVGGVDWRLNIYGGAEHSFNASLYWKLFHAVRPVEEQQATLEAEDTAYSSGHGRLPSCLRKTIGMNGVWRGGMLAGVVATIGLVGCGSCSLV